MDEKYKKYQEFSWKDSQEWQTYLNGLYPVPPLKVLDKFKKKWYKKNIDKDFDVNYDHEDAKRNENAQQQRQAPPPGANPYGYAYRQAVHEEMPSIKPYVAVAYLLFILTVLFSGITNKICLAA